MECPLLRSKSHFLGLWHSVFSTKDAGSVIFAVEIALYLDLCFPSATRLPRLFLLNYFAYFHEQTFTHCRPFTLPRPHLPLLCPTPPACSKRYLLGTLHHRLILSSITTCVETWIFTQITKNASSIKTFLLSISLRSQCPPCFLTVPLSFHALSECQKLVLISSDRW